MKIVYILESINKGTGLIKNTLFQVDYFIKKFEYDIEIVSLDQKSNNSESFAFEVNDKVKLHFLDIHSKGLKRYFEKINRLNKKLKQIAPDIVMVCINEIYGLYIPSLIRKKNPFIYQRHSTRNLNNMNTRGIKKYLKNIIISKSGLGYDRFVLLSKENMKEWPHIKKKVVINNPITLNPVDIQAKLDNKVVLAVGRQHYVKGFDMLLEAWKKVIQNNPDWVLKFYGKINESLGLDKIANDLGLGNSVEFNEHTDDMISAYLGGSILVSSSRHEGFPLVLIESMSLGLPIVSFDYPHGPREIITNSEDGILVETNNINQLSKSLQLLISNVKLRKSMGNMARKNIKRFSPDIVMKEWEKLINEVILCS